jgi:hypothetical protein
MAVAWFCGFSSTHLSHQSNLSWRFLCPHSPGISFCCIPLIRFIRRRESVISFRGFFLLGPAELGVPLKTGKGVHGSRGFFLVFPMHTGNLPRLVLNEGSTSALDYYKRARCAYIMRTLCSMPRPESEMRCDL